MRRWRPVLVDGDDSTEVLLAGADGGDRRRVVGAVQQRRRRRLDSGAPASEPGLGASAPTVARWLGDIRSYFPSTVVQVMQRDAIERLNLTQLLLEPEMLEAVEPDVHLVGTLLSLNRVMPETDPAGRARGGRPKVVAELERRLAQKTRAAVTGALNRAARVNRPAPPRHRLESHHPRQPQALPAGAAHDRARAAGRLRPRGRSAVQRDVVLCVDQSGSMAASVVYSGVFGAVLASHALAAHVAGGLRHRRGRPDRRSCTTRSRCCSAPSWAAAPTSTAPSPTARA